MVKTKEYMDFIDNFKKEKFHRSTSMNGYDLYTYSSSRGKFGVSNYLLDILDTDFSAIENKLCLSIIKRLKQGHNFEESCVVYLKYSTYAHVCSTKYFKIAIDKFVEYEFLIRTPIKKMYIVNPRFVNKFFKIKVEK